MRIFIAEQLSDILIKHSKWLKSEEDGERADLSYANLSSADLRYADLSYANLSSADLRYADLSYADLRYADLSSADLRYADLSYADLRYADLRYANLSYADLRYADLSSADLRYADLSLIKNDLFGRLTKAKDEVPGLYDAIIRGKVDGSQYEGECACFCGTIANIRKEDYREMKIDLRPDSSSATERWFMAINKGDTPANNNVSRITYEWIKEFMKENNIKRPKYRLVSSFDFPEIFKK